MGEKFGEIKVMVVQGRGLVIRDFNSSDPYVILKLGNQTAKTKVINSCLNPVWNQEFHFYISEHAHLLNFQVFDKDHFKADDKMGNAHLSLQPLVASARLRKISDFGLAKLCSKEKSVVTMTEARGTMGYIAPEVLSSNFGKASHKSDVYSFGMMLLEMVGGRKNFDAKADISQMNFPEWIHQRLNEGEELKIRIEEDDDIIIIRKLAIIGLWCIQWSATDRPSIKVVTQMLEGDGSNLTVPPPFTTRNTTHVGPSTQELTVISELE